MKSSTKKHVESKDEKIIGKEDLPHNHVMMSGKQKAKIRS